MLDYKRNHLYCHKQKRILGNAHDQSDGMWVYIVDGSFEQHAADSADYWAFDGRGSAVQQSLRCIHSFRPQRERLAEVRLMNEDI